ncbi:unnamed protein product [Spirodela intermedia]|uniref:Uncharacterized protein n=1 Tax=Spirodela intermedia TaxID=51605 RepID=A0A7I8K150_SPIIN|nr:unnamed protein product [Spirodela intermedia]
MGPGPFMDVVFSNSDYRITPISSFHGELFHCESLVKNWATSSNMNTIKESKSSLKDLLFFLHVPRTGGRTYFQCFLRKLYTGDQECPRSYDKLRFDPSKSDCRLMATHDDYSLMSKLPVQRTSVVTILRNPIDRVFSTYEFAVEVAARFLVHPNLTSAIQMSMRIRPKTRSVSTLDIWPWKYLVPWMREDLFDRRVARRTGKLQRVQESDPYNTEEMVMPLHMFIDDPISHDIIHNGATFQVAGLTNNSWSDEAHEVRHCVRNHPVLGRYVLEVAKKRLDHMLYVGLTEEHKKSATMFANMVGAQVISQSESSSSHFEKAVPHNKTEMCSSLPYSYGGGSNSLNMTVGKLMEAYEECISILRKSQSTRRTASLKRISPVNFSKKARLLVPEEVLERIRSLNNLDLQLYEHAQGIFAHQRRHLTVQNEEQSSQELAAKKVGVLSALYSYLPWKVLLISITALILAAPIYMLVTARRSLKLKV